MNKNVVIREYKEGDEASILKLRGLVLSGSKDMDWWVWQHKLNPAGQAIIAVAEDKDTKGIIGHHNYLPMRLKVGDSTCQMVTTADLMVHPDYRRLGIYRKLRQRLHELSRKKHLQFAYSFPNELAASIRDRLGSGTILKKTPLWVKSLHLNNVLFRYLNINRKFITYASVIGKMALKIADRSRNYQVRTQIREVKIIDERFNSLWQQASSHHMIMLVRDRAYLDWRYIKRPDADYTIYISEQEDQLLGYIVLRTTEENGLKSGWIADILTKDKKDPAAMDLIAKTVQHFKATDTDIILCVMPPKAYLTPILRKHGFILISKWIGSKYPIDYDPFEPTYPETMLTNPNNWYITRGDSDLI
jgi:GNAT superfamily N-acetyltransferase